MVNLSDRANRILEHLDSQLDLSKVEKKIRGRVKSQMEKSQKEYYLNEQMKALKKELGEIDDAEEAEQLEAMAYDNLSKTFADRFAAELEVKKSAAERRDYDASTEVAALKEEFAELRKSLTAKDDEIRKATEVAFSLPEGFPTTADAMAEMSWGDIHNLARRVN